MCEAGVDRPVLGGGCGGFEPSNDGGTDPKCAYIKRRQGWSEDGVRNKK